MRLRSVLLSLLLLLPSLVLAQEQYVIGAKNIDISADESLTLCSGSGNIKLATGCGANTPTTELILDKATGALSFDGDFELDNLSLADGTAAAPSLSYASDTNTGVYLAGADTLSFSTGGVIRTNINSDGNLQMWGGQIRGSAGTVAFPGFAFFSDSSTGLYSAGADSLGVAVGGANVATFESDNLIVSGNISAADGTAAAPSLSFSSDGDTGIYRSAGNQISFAIGGADGAVLDGDKFRINQPLWAAAGTAATPSLSFAGDQNTGLYSAGADSLGVAVGGANVATFESGGLSVSGEIAPGGATTSGGALCTKSDGNIGQCSDAVGTGGTCTCE